MLIYELYKIMVNKVTFVDFTGDDRPNRPPGSALVLPLHKKQIKQNVFQNKPR